ncbi:MAG: DNA mismatch repair endonuclease MutL [Acutalibacteraceae bacterium]|jgi:DNA mismatch repair protein MutL
MAKINVLDKQLAELIAAGEVVERPASAAKELVENAVDAGATSITVEIQNGGVTFLRVSDNGCGIAREDVPLAFLRHATSKIRSQDDLAGIGTLGFRGEALASVCAMARVELLTRTEEELAGTRYVIEGGIEKSCEDAGCPVGTTILVRDLFYNTPARMKFLKKDVSEGNAVAGVVDKAALSHPEIAFRFLRDGKETLRTPGDGKLKSAIFAVYGRQFVSGLIPVEYLLGAVRVSGFVSRPADARPSRAMQSFYINGRFVKSRTAGAAVDEAAKGSVMVGKYLSCVLHLTVPAAAVDVNVHPAKIEVRFVTERPIFDAVYHAVKSALAQGDRPAELRLPQQEPKQQGRAQPTPTAEPLHSRLNDAAGGGYFVQKFPPQQVLSGFLQKSAPRAEAEEPPRPIQTGIERLPVKNADAADEEYVIEKPSLRPFGSPLPEKAADLPRVEEDRFEKTELPQKEESLLAEPKTAVGQVPKDESAAAAAEPGAEQSEPFTAEPESRPLRFVGEVFGTYILLESADELVFIDKHAAHERILYEKLRAQQGERYAQQLLSPVTVTMDKDSYSALLAAREQLSRAGFELEDFGGGTLLVRSAPLSFGEQDITDALFEIAAHLQENRRDISTEHDDWLLHNIACRAAVKGGDKSSERELTALAQQLHEHPEIRYCPHGRPVYLSMKKRELEKQFGRIP